MENKGCEACFEFFNSGGSGGFNCAEATMYGISTALGIDNKEILKIATPFGGGLGRNGYICGSLAAGLMMLGLKFGRNDPEQPREPGYEAADKLLAKFKSHHESINCRDITGLDLKSIDNTGEQKQKVHQGICQPLVREICEWVTEIYEEAEQK